MSQYHEEEILGKAYDGRLARRLLTYLYPYRRVVGASILLLVMVSGLRLIGPYLTLVAIDRYVTTGEAKGLTSIALIYLLVLVVQFGLSFVQMDLMNWTGQKIMFDLRMEIFSHVQRLHMKYFDQNPVGRLITRMTTDVDVLNELFTAGVVSIFGDIFSLGGIVLDPDRNIVPNIRVSLSGPQNQTVNSISDGTFQFNWRKLKPGKYWVQASAAASGVSKRLMVDLTEEAPLLVELVLEPGTGSISGWIEDAAGQRLDSSTSVSDSETVEFEAQSSGSVHVKVYGYRDAKADYSMTIAVEMAEHRVRVNVIQPGWTDTPGERQFSSEEQLREGAKRLPWKRLGTPEDLGKAAAFLASDDADYVTATMMRVDGGMIAAESHA